MDSQKFMKKRGRPRKNQLIQKPHKNSDSKKIINHEKEIILHLAIPMNKTLNSVNEELTQSDDSEKNNFTTLTNENDIMLSDITDEENKLDSLGVSDEYESDNFDNENLIKDIKQKDFIIKNLQNEIKKIKTEKVMNYERQINYKPMNLKLICIKTGKSVVLDKTNIACWWCTYNFETMPCFMPDKYHDNAFHVYGCFCSFNCKLAYNLKYLNDHRMMERYSLIMKMYRTIYEIYEENKLSDIQIAPDREILEKFGGPMSIVDYRKNFVTCKSEYKMKIPPLINIVPFLEEKSKVEIVSSNTTRQDNSKKSNMGYNKKFKKYDEENIFDSMMLRS